MVRVYKRLFALVLALTLVLTSSVYSIAGNITYETGRNTEEYVSSEISADHIFEVEIDEEEAVIADSEDNAEVSEDVVPIKEEEYDEKNDDTMPEAAEEIEDSVIEIENGLNLFGGGEGVHDLSVYKSDGITEATEGEDYEWLIESENEHTLNLLEDDLVVKGSTEKETINISSSVRIVAFDNVSLDLDENCHLVTDMGGNNSAVRIDMTGYEDGEEFYLKLIGETVIITDRDDMSSVQTYSTSEANGKVYINSSEQDDGSLIIENNGLSPAIKISQWNGYNDTAVIDGICFNYLKLDITSKGIGINSTLADVIFDSCNVKIHSKKEAIKARFDERYNKEGLTIKGTTVFTASASEAAEAVISLPLEYNSRLYTNLDKEGRLELEKTGEGSAVTAGIVKLQGEGDIYFSNDDTVGTITVSTDSSSSYLSFENSGTTVIKNKQGFAVDSKTVIIKSVGESLELRGNGRSEDGKKSYGPVRSNGNYQNSSGYVLGYDIAHEINAEKFTDNSEGIEFIKEDDFYFFRDKDTKVSPQAIRIKASPLTIFWSLNENGNLTIASNEKDTAQKNIVQEGHFMSNSSFHLYSTGTWKTLRESIKTVEIRDSLYAVNIEEWFSDATNLEKISGLSNLITDKTQSMGKMFLNCSKLKELDFTGCDFSNVETFLDKYTSWSKEGMCQNCSSLATVSMAGNKFSKAKRLENMFKGCIKLENADFSGCEFSEGTDISGMFENCPSFTTYPIESFDFENIVSAEDAVNVDDDYYDITICHQLDFSKAKNLSAKVLDDILNNDEHILRINCPAGLTGEAELNGAWKYEDTGEMLPNEDGSYYLPTKLEAPRWAVKMTMGYIAFLESYDQNVIDQMVADGAELQEILSVIYSKVFFGGEIMIEREIGSPIGEIDTMEETGLNNLLNSYREEIEKASGKEKEEMIAELEMYELMLAPFIPAENETIKYKKLIMTPDEAAGVVFSLSEDYLTPETLFEVTEIEKSYIGATLLVPFKTENSGKDDHDNRRSKGFVSKKQEMFLTALSSGTWTYNAATDTWSYALTESLKNTWAYIWNPFANKNLPQNDWFYFDENGIMLTGWQLLLWNGTYKWYYLNPLRDSRRGACQMGGMTPDGYMLNADGSWAGF